MTSFRNRASERTDRIETAVAAVNEDARPLAETDDLQPLVQAASDSRYVLLGEATHGTGEFYRWRTRLTAELVREGEVSFVAVEGDWTDCYEVNRYVKGVSDHDTAVDVLSAIDRWPTWMWANWEVVEFVEWLAEYNRDRPEDEQVGFYGMDVYSLFESMETVIDYLERTDPDAAERAREAYQCFEPYGGDAREYARSTRLVPDDCEDEVVEILADFEHAPPTDDGDLRDERFNAEQNALVAAHAEEYYRALGRADINSWNVRDRHMVETLDRLADHHGTDAAGTDTTGIVWAHNTHVGDARATNMADRGEVNIGQLVREAHGSDDVCLVGFGTHHGGVTAGTRWGGPMQRMTVPPARTGSYEDVFHRSDSDDCLLVFDEDRSEGPLGESRGHRAIGVVYDPEREAGNYVPTVLPERYDAFVFVDETESVHPLHVEPDGSEEPETYPWGV